MRDLTTKIDELNLIDDTLNKDMKRILFKKKVLTHNNIPLGLITTEFCPK